jgi:CxxC motif-containing protein (DUF1111 family)
MYLPLKKRAALFFLAGACLWAQADTGVRSGPPGAGGPIQGLTPDQTALFNLVATRFSDLHSVGGAIQGEPGQGLGPGYNGNGCGACHTFPAPGGSSPFVNPQIGMATLDNAQNAIPSFLSSSGPIRVARFVLNPDGSPDGGVHNLFTIQGRTDAPGCTLAQTDFQKPLAANNVVFRIPTPVFGSGLIENISDETILASQAATASNRRVVGITGHANRNPNDGTISRFGWKAQNKSILIFSGEAYNVEMGVTNELFPTERNMAPGCRFNSLPEDHQDSVDNSATGGSPSFTENFATFMRLLAPPAPAPATPSTANGLAVFADIGCSLCHTPSMTTEGSKFSGLSQQPVNLFSDLLVHHMGVGLADGITQGSAGPDEFRSAPLWGLGQRVFFLHDGRTKDLVQAILAHRSEGSEANLVIFNFTTLDPQSQQDLISFLRSL